MLAPTSTVPCPGGRSRVIPWRFATKKSHFSGVDRAASPVITLSSFPASVAIEEFGHMTGICASVLKQRSMTRVRVDDELRIGQIRAESKRIDGGNHDVVIPVGNQYRLRDLLQISEGLSSGFLPSGHRCDLGSGRLCSGWSVLIFCPPCQPLHKLAPSRLARFRGCEKQRE